jgi:molybdenum cofactor cytidylyltransferase
MRLTDALRISSRRVVAFVGAGGKSTAIACVAAEVSAEFPIIVTTTTHLALSQRTLAKAHLVAADVAALRALPGLLAEHRSVLVTGPVARGEPRWSAAEANVLKMLRRIASATGAALLIEADGARGLSLKVPGEREPVIPRFADMVVPVAGLDALGTSLDGGLVHHPERVAALLWIAPGEKLQPAHLSRLLVDPAGGLKKIPPGAEVRVLLTRAEEDRLGLGREVAAGVLASGSVRAVVLGRLSSTQPAVEVHGRVAGVVLAAGASNRLRRPKQLVPWRGKPLVWHAVRAALDGGLAPVVVVVGADEEGVREALRDEPVSFIQNRTWQEGQSTSVRAGLGAVGRQADAVVFVLSDTPRVDGRLVAALVHEHRVSLTPIVAPQAAGRWANPVLFDRVTFRDLASLYGDMGGRLLFDRFRMAGIQWDPSILLDIDTAEDLRELERLSEEPE